MIEDFERRAKTAQKRKYLFCMLKDRNQKISVEICRKKACQFLEDGDQGIIDCHHHVSMGYVSAFKGNWRKRREEEKEKEEE